MDVFLRAQKYTVAQKGQTQTNFRKQKPISENTNQIPKMQIRFRKHKPISKSTNQFRETLTNFQKHKPKSQNTNQNSRERPGKESIHAVIHEVLRTQENTTFCYHCGQKQEEEFIYCPYRGVQLEAAVPSYRLLSSGDDVSVREAIANYFHSGFEYEAILGFLSKCHGTKVAQAKLAYVIRSQVNLHTLRNLHVI